MANSSLRATKLKKSLNIAPIKRTVVRENAEKKSVGDLLKTAVEETEGTAEIKAKPMNSSSEEIQVTPVASTSANNFDELLGVLGDVDKKYENVTDADFYKDKLITVPDELDISEVEVPEINEEKLRAEVTESETSKTEIEKNKERRDTEVKTKAKESEIEALRENAEAEKAEIGEIYDEYKLSAESDAIKRGLARSSVALLSMDNIEGARAKELSRVAENLTSSINQVEAEIGELQADLEVSLSNLDLELAVNINNSIKERIDELKKAQADAIEFNNKVSQMQAEYALKVGDKKKEAQEYEAELAKQYEGSANEARTQEKLEIAMDYYGKMNKIDALREIVSSTDLASALGDGFYDLYYYIMRK